MDDLASAYSEGQGGRGTLDYLRIVSEPRQTASIISRCSQKSARNIWSSHDRLTPWILWTSNWYGKLEPAESFAGC